MTQMGRGGGGRRFRSRPRAAAWCLLRTARDARAAAAAGRPLAGRDLWRLLARRLGDLSGRPIDVRAMDDWVKAMATKLDVPDHFGRDFEHLTGASPFSWQRRLFAEFAAFDAQTHPLPRRLDIPTGLGKTSVIPIWHLARQVNPRLPRRLVYVVNRRTIVDQATDIADTLRRKCPGEFHVSTLRGALADNGDWQLDPAAPAIIVGTVDMIGSRLLFNAYRGSRWHRSFAAGLMGIDSLIVHDEAHLTGPFDALLDRVMELQKGRECGPRMQALSLSATATRQADAAEKVLELTPDDLDDPVVRRRVFAAKRLTIEELPPKKKLAHHLAALAATYRDLPVRVMVFVQFPSLATEVAKEIRKTVSGEDRVEVLTGTIRGKERDTLVGKPVVQHFVNRTAPPGGAVYLVATSAGEVGADFDADHLVCDLSPLDSMIQRLGRVNRRGERTDTRVQVVAEFTKKPGRYDEQRKATRGLLETLPRNDQGHDVSPQSLRSLMEQEAYRAAMTPSPAQVTLQPPTLDAWTLTSVDVDWPVACDVDPYLHGLRDDERNTEVAWRREFDDVAADDLAEENLEKIFEVYPLRPRELLKEPTANVVRFLLDLKDKRPDAWVVVAGRVLKTLVLKTLTERALEEEIVNRTVIIPAKHGGLNQSGILDTSQIGTPANDVADQLSNKPHDSADASEDRVRIVLTKTGGEWAWDSPPGGALLDPGPTEEGWRKWQRDFSGLNGNEWRLAYAIERPSHDEDDGVGGVQMFWRRASTKRAATVRLLLDDHNRDVHERAEASAAAVGLAATLFRAVSHAAAAHDLGKGRELWQKAVYNNDPALKLAKSTGRGMKWQSLDGYRHEYGSLNDLLKQEEFARLGEDAGDLALHLVAAHHGRGRPHFPKGGRDPESAGTPASELTPAAIALRFIRLQRKYGPWGLAWLESMLVCADREASQNPKRRT